MTSAKTISRDLLLLVGLGLLLWGLAAHGPDWRALGPRLADHLLMAAIAAGALALLGWRLRVAPARLAWLAGLPLLALGLAGLPALAATALLLAGGVALGTLLPAIAGVSVLVRWVAGIGLLAGLAGWSLPFPVHHAPAWGLLLLGLVTWRRRAVAAEARALASEVRQAVAAAPLAALAVGLLALVATAPAWLPVRMADDTAYHLMLAWELREFGHARFDVGTQIWTLAPWSTDVLHALAMLLAQRESIGTLNAFWLLCTAWLVRGVAVQAGLSPRWAWLASAAWVSLPMTYMLSGSMQVESASPAWFTALAAVLLARTDAAAPRLLVVALLAGVLVGAKTSHGLLLLPFGLWMVLQMRPDFPWRRLPLALGLATIAGGSSYFYATWLVGNPVFPLANGLFGSPWFRPENFVDPLWTQGLAWNLPWRLVFAPDAYHEGGFSGAAGYLLLAGLGGLLLSLAERTTRALALATLAALALLLGVVQYLRYLQPLMPLLLMLMVAGFAGPASRWRGPALAGVLALQVFAWPASNWGLMDRIHQVWLREGPDAVLLRTLPERLLAQRFRAISAPNDVVLFSQAAHGAMAELPGQAIAASWHSETVWRIRRLGEDWPAMVAAAGATHLVARDTGLSPKLQAYLAESGAVEVARAGPAALYALPATPATVQVEAAKGEAVKLWIPLDAQAPSTGQVEVRLRCTDPGHPVSLKWTMDRPDRDPMERWDLVHCRPNGEAFARLRFDSLAVDGRLALETMATDDLPDRRFELLQVEAVRRRDPFAGTERFHVVWDALCARPGCARQRSRLAPDSES